MEHKNFAPVPPKTFSQLRKLNDDYWDEALECPETVLETAAGKISLRLLNYCAYYAPDIAYEIRLQLSSKRRAIVLTQTIDMANIAFSDYEIKPYLDEVSDSMIDHPSVWTAAYGSDWSIICWTIQRFLGVDFGEPLLFDVIFDYPQLPSEPPQVESRRKAKRRNKYPDVSYGPN